MLQVEHIYKTFFPGTINEKRALVDTTLHLKPGDFTTVIGSNGAGKSTMLNAIAGVWPIDKGRIVIDGVDITKEPEHKRARYIGRVFQDPMLGTAAGMMIEENLAIASRRGQFPGLSWSSSSEQHDRFYEMLKELNLGLEDRMTAHVGLLSGGQRQALTLLMATIKKPKLLLLDEHTAALDPKTAEKVLELTDTIVKRDQLTTLMITHNMRDALRFGNRLIMMHEGRVEWPVISCCWGNHGATFYCCGKSNHPPVSSDRHGHLCPLAEDADGYGTEACKCDDFPGVLFLHDVLQHVYDHDRDRAAAPAAGIYRCGAVYHADAVRCGGMHGGKG